MALTFEVVLNGSFEGQIPNMAYLHINNWDDYGSKTLFYLTVYDEQGNGHKIGNVKIGLIDQNQGWTKDQLQKQFDVLSGDFYSLGQDADYYRNIVESLSNKMALNVLTAIGDVTHDPDRLAIAENESVFNGSLLRSVNRTSIEHQFKRILRHKAPLTKYDFFYEKKAGERYSGINVEFKINPKSKPSSNIHILIGRNGVGKTTLLNNMVAALLPGRGEVRL